MSNTPKTDALFFPFGRDATAAAEPSLLVCMTQYELLERENAAQLKEFYRISEALSKNEGHSSVTHIEILREKLKDCSAAFDRQQGALDRNAEQIAALRLDAERYRWLRDNRLTGGFRGVKFDTAIDTAMKEEGKCGTVRIAAEEAFLGKAQSEYICTCGIRVTPHKCPTDNDF